MATLDEYAKGLADLKKLYVSGDTTAAGKGTELRKKAIAENIDMGALDAKAFELSGIKPSGTTAQQAAYEKQNQTTAIKSAATDKVSSSFGGGSAGSNASGMTYTNPNLEKAGTLHTMYDKIMTDGFKYSKDNDPNYTALKQQYEEGAQTASNKTMSMMADRGILSSSITTNQMDRIQQDANKGLQLAVPGLEANAYDRWHTGLQDLRTSFLDTYNMGIDDRNFTYDQADKNAARDGTYEDPQATALMKGIIDLKNQYAGASKDQQKVISSAADELRSRLGQLGYDPNKFGSNVTSGQATKNLSSAGIQTNAAKETDFNHKVTEAGLTGMYNGKPTYQSIQDKRQLAASNSGNSLGWAKYNYDQHQTEAMNRWVGDMIGAPDRQHAIDYIVQNRDSIMNKDHLDMKSLYDWVDKAFPQGKATTPESHTPSFDDASKMRLQVAQDASKDPAFKALNQRDQATYIQGWVDFYMGKASAPPTLGAVPPINFSGGLNLHPTK